MNNLVKHTKRDGTIEFLYQLSAEEVAALKTPKMKSVDEMNRQELHQEIIRRLPCCQEKTV